MMAWPALPDPLPPDASKAGVLLAVTASLFAVALAFYACRVYTRVYSSMRIRPDEYFMFAAIVLTAVQYGIFLQGIHLGVGRHVYYSKPASVTKAMRGVWIQLLLWTWSITLIKISIAVMLLRIRRDNPWRYWVYFLIGFVVSSAIVSTVLQFVQCSPVSAFWNPTVPGAKCWTPNKRRVSLYTIAAVFIAADVTLSLLPLTFVAKLRRPLREKVIICGLTGLGLFATAAALIKLLLIKHYVSTVDTLWEAVELGMWEYIEEFVGIIAACIPCLKAPFERLLRKYGLISTADKLAAPKAYRSSYRNLSRERPGHVTNAMGRGQAPRGNIFDPESRASFTVESGTYDMGETAGKGIMVHREFEVRSER
ncbi:hypothetical protein EJ06DRAFT_496547 [Trichodelitschia bisporula]|uniref:Rhodopsin domain-containing protein n=1 Tax=Trichodelitschia bisporula TaxID=703511 RepID=A0A6G1HRZ5_9PEZI|nr:hypothetical protein EJ06DRAFT_496547 [Trichodelitschia bisporula]